MSGQVYKTSNRRQRDRVLRTGEVFSFDPTVILMVVELVLKLARLYCAQ